MGSKIDKHGVVRTRRVHIVEHMDGFHGPAGATEVEDITEDLEKIAETLDKTTLAADSRIGFARGRLERILDVVDFDGDEEGS